MSIFVVRLKKNANQLFMRKIHPKENLHLCGILHVCGFPFLQELERITEKKRAVQELRAQLDREKQTSQGLQKTMKGITDRNTAKHSYSKGTPAAEVMTIYFKILTIAKKYHNKFYTLTNQMLFKIAYSV